MAVKRTTRRVAAAATAAALSWTLSSCGSGASSAPATGEGSPASTTTQAANTPPTGTVSVAISNYSYHPATITVARGTAVTFTNRDDTAHTATSKIPGFDTGTLKPGQHDTIHLNKPGTYTYYCQFHAFMQGTLIVK